MSDAWKELPEVVHAMRALTALRLEVPESIARDILMRVQHAFEAVAKFPPPLDPTDADLSDPLFTAVWSAIKGWDLERTRGAGYAGASGTDAMTIVNAVRELQGHNRPRPMVRTIQPDDGPQQPAPSRTFIGFQAIPDEDALLASARPPDAT